MPKKHKTRIAEKVIIDIFAKLLTGIKVLNDYSGFHVIIRPENIMILDENSQVKITGFRVISLLDQLTKTPTTWFGSELGYMAPEVMDDNRFTIASDLWGLGCVLYEMMTFQFPFGLEGAASVYNAVMDGDIIPINRNYNRILKQAAFELLKKDPLFRMTYQSCLELPILPKTDFRPTARELTLAAVKYQDGIGGFQKDIHESMRLFRLAADQGDSWAMLGYGYGCAHGFEGKEDLRKAQLYYKKSAEAGNARGMSRYGYALTKGYDGSPDYGEAIYQFRKSAELNDSLGLSNYGVSLAKGFEGKKDRQKAKDFYKMSAQYGNVEGIHNYGYACEKRYDGSQDLPEALRHYKKAKDLQHAKGLHNYAHFQRKYLTHKPRKQPKNVAPSAPNQPLNPNANQPVNPDPNRKEFNPYRKKE